MQIDNRLVIEISDEGTKGTDFFGVNIKLRDHFLKTLGVVVEIIPQFKNKVHKEGPLFTIESSKKLASFSLPFEIVGPLLQIEAIQKGIYLDSNDIIISGYVSNKNKEALQHALSIV